MLESAIRHRRRTGIWLAASAALLLAVTVTGAISESHPASAAGPANVENVKDYGAVGNGTTDDTTAFQTAISASTTSKNPIYVPWGTYKITQKLILKRQLLFGQDGGSYASDTAGSPPGSPTLPTILATNTANSAFELQDGGAISGVGFDYAQGTTPTIYATTILLNGIGTRVSNVKIDRAWKGIESTGSNTGRAIIQDVFISNVAKQGIMLDAGWDAITVDNVEVWTPDSLYGGSFRTGGGIGIEVRHADAFHMQGVLVFGAGTGVLLQGTSSGSAWGTIDNLTTDLCNVGIQIGDHSLITLNNTTNQSIVNALVVNGSDVKLNVAGNHFRSNVSAAVHIQNAYAVTVTSSEIQRTDPGGSGPALLIDGGAKVTMTGNDVSGSTAGVQIDASSGIVLLAENTIVANTHAGALVNNATNPFTRVADNIIYP